MKRLALFAALTLAACSSIPDPAQSLYAAESAYEAGLTIAVAYRQLPTCGGSAVLCHDPAVVAKLVTMDDAAKSALAGAQVAVEQHTNDADQLVAVAVSLATAYQSYTLGLKVK
jgi:hypothetical protein